ncbi:hypothetical protein N7449_000612 [Penicillium cf. viridicatum]|uniref:Uncharacterized protein n=1 Tax=Penicillium cf. viridicatum TaxID=2972119 RepID=A0A9W9N6F9_9EURO|nr:hypothetical protein N7449_000612 [Penicillium cf. viridicatum]
MHQYGGDTTLTRLFLVCNDTGGNVLTVFKSDLDSLQFNSTQHAGALQGASLMETSLGQAPQDTILVDMQIVTSSLVELTPWFVEIAVIKPDNMGAARLSGAAMRRRLFFATAPGNDRLYVAQKKAGLIRDLPT